MLRVPLLSLLLITTLPVWAEGTPADPSAVIKQTSDAVMELLAKYRDGYDADPEPLRREIAAVLKDRVDYASIVRGVVGKYRPALNHEQTAGFLTTFRRSVIELYTGALIAVKTSSIEVRPAVLARSDRARVDMRVTTADHDFFELSYSMANDGDGWKVRNIVVGGINLGMTYRNQFDALMEHYDGDVDQVIDNWMQPPTGQ